METRYLKASFSYIGLLILLWLKRELSIAYMLYLPLLIIPKTSWEEYGINIRGWKRGLKLFLLACLLFLLPFSIGSIKLSLSRGFKELPLNFILYQFIGAALPEEVFFRGYIQTELKKSLKNAWISIILTSSLFMIAHLFKGLNPVNFGVFLPSLVFGYLREKTGSILWPILFHALSNILFFSLF